MLQKEERQSQVLFWEACMVQSSAGSLHGFTGKKVWLLPPKTGNCYYYILPSAATKLLGVWICEKKITQTYYDLMTMASKQKHIHFCSNDCIFFLGICSCCTCCSYYVLAKLVVLSLEIDVAFLIAVDLTKEALGLKYQFAVMTSEVADD